MSYRANALKFLSPSSWSFRRLSAWLSPADVPRTADLIFVLAGRVYRKDYALELFRQGLASRILFSVGRFEIRRFSKMALPVPLDLLKIAQDVPPPERHYFVFFQAHEVRTEHIPPQRFGTLMEIEALARWLTSHPNVRSVLVTSSPTHLRRIRMCCRSLLDPSLKIAFLAAPFSASQPPVSSAPAGEQSPLPPTVTAAEGTETGTLFELFKLSLYWILLKIR